jgi:serine/threonine-protein kinase
MSAVEMIADTVADMRFGNPERFQTDEPETAEALIQALNRSLATRLKIKSRSAALPAKITASSGSVYEILKVLGRGGMGTVFLARRQHDNQLVALKVSRWEEDLAAQDVIRREAEILARINHSSIVKLVEAGETATGYPFLAMEYASGESLQQILRRSGPLPFDQVKEICLQVARAIGALHMLGIFHRDLKPANIIVSTASDELKVTLIDFGISEFNTEEPPIKSDRTSGSLFYLSPEQLHDDLFSCRSEIYQLALIMFECLTGRLPFNPSIGDAILYRLSGNVFPADRNAASYLFPSVCAFLRKALARNQDSRHASMAEFEMALKAINHDLSLAA